VGVGVKTRFAPATKDVNKIAFAQAAILILFGLAQIVSGQNAQSAAAAGHHKVQVNDRALGRKIGAGGARLIADYGGFQLYDALDSMTNFPADKAELRDDYNLILLNASRLDTTTTEVKALRKTVGSFAGRRMHLVQFAGPIKPDWRRANGQLHSAQHLFDLWRRGGHRARADHGRGRSSCPVGRRVFGRV
jgi:hypothetical protein